MIFAILVSVMVLAVGTSIINISLKQVILSGTGRESQFAFYAANTGMECALYWDLAGLSLDAETGEARYVFPPPGGERINDEAFFCAGKDIKISNSDHLYTNRGWVTTTGEEVSTTVFRLAISNSLPELENVLYCAEVTVTKKIDNNNGSVTTNIISQGLNTCDPKNDKRAVQRGLELEYRS